MFEHAGAVMVDEYEALLETAAFFAKSRPNPGEGAAIVATSGGAAIMAADLSTTPTTDIPVQLCGDAHLSNFGLFNGPDRRLLFDLNDFDETLPGPFDWDLKRLAASVTIAPVAVAMSRIEAHPKSRSRPAASIRGLRQRA